MNTNFMNKNFMDRLFKPVTNMVWDITNGRLGYKTKEGIVTIELGELNEDKTEAKEPQVSINPFDDFSMEVPAFSQSTPIENISLGDVVYGKDQIHGWVVKKTNKTFRLMKPDGTVSSWTPPKTQLLGFETGVMIVKNLLNLLPGGGDGLNKMQSSLGQMMIMSSMMGGDNMDLEKILPFMLMGQTGVGGSDMNMGNMLPMMMLMGAMKDKNPNSSNSSGRNNTNFFNR